MLDSQKRVFSWGFGGYGRLGHAEQKDEMVPRLVKLFDFPGRGASQICTGYQCSFAVSEMGKRSWHIKLVKNVLNLGFGQSYLCCHFINSIGKLIKHYGQEPALSIH